MDETSYQMYLQQQAQQNLQQQPIYSYYNNVQPSSYSNVSQPPQYNMSIYSNVSSNHANSNYMNKLHDTGSVSALPPPPSLPPPPPPQSRPPLPPPPQQNQMQYSTGQPYYQYTQQNFENYSFQNMINQQSNNTFNNYANYQNIQPVLDQNIPQNTNSNNHFNYTNNNTVYQNYANQNSLPSNGVSIGTNQNNNVQYSPIKKSPNSKPNTLKNIDVAELKKYIKQMSIEAKKNNNELNDNINEDMSKLVSSAVISRTNMAVPKYMKPKICKSPMLIHLVKSKQIIKPQAQLAISPLPQSSMDFRIENNDHNNVFDFYNEPNLPDQDVYQNFTDLKKEFNMNNIMNCRDIENKPNFQTLPPPILPPPPPPLSVISNIPPPPSALPKPPPQRDPPPPPPFSQPAFSILKSVPRGPPPPAHINILPPPPGQRPISPPNMPPPIQRNSNNLNYVNSKVNSRSNVINNSLLNSLLNNSLNQSENNNRKGDIPYNSTTNTYDQNVSFNSSFNSSSINNSTVHNNSVFNISSNTNNNSVLSNYNSNYHAMLVSPNMRTLYDNKKLPPPPYPGKIEQSTEITSNRMETEENHNHINSENSDENINNKANFSSTTSSMQSTSSSIVRYCSPQAYKFYMEQHAENILKNHKAREYRSFQLENEMTKVDLPPALKDQMRKLLRQKETNYLRLRRAKMNKSMFENIKVLGLGAFGQVDLVRKRDDMQRLYAMKILHKSDIFNRNQAAHVKAERDILAEADNEWVVKLYYSFQDEENLYFVMDYVPGGDLMNLLIKLQIFSEELSKFYIGELTCAIESVHNLGFIHRDIKPDNILIDKCGHIKLTDFGLCTGFHWTHNSKYYQTDHAYNRILEQKLANTNPISTGNSKASDKRLMAHSLVGTPNYIAPEILSRKGYTKSCDWWSVGVILYEMLVGEPPFRDETALGTQSKVINYKKSLKIPKECELSKEASDLIFKLCTDADTRLGSTGIKAHSFFKNFDFGPNLRLKEAPYVPPLKHPTDTQNFEPVDNIALADRQARLNDINSPRFSPYNICQSGLNSDIEKNNHSNNSMLYEFTFRRFFDEAYSSDNFLRYTDKDSNSFSSFIKSIGNDNKDSNNVINDQILDEKNRIKTGSSNNNKFNKDFPESNGQEMDSENSIQKSMFINGNNPNNLQIFKAADNNILANNRVNPEYFNKLVSGGSSGSSSNLNLNDMKENRNDDNQAPIFV